MDDLLEFYFDVVINIKHRRRSPPISRCDPATIQRESFPPWSTWDEIDNVEEYHILVNNHKLKNDWKIILGLTKKGTVIEEIWACIASKHLSLILYYMLILIDVSWIIIITLYTFLLTHLRFFFVLICSDKIAYRTNATATPSLVPPIHLKKNSIHVRTLFRASCMFLSFFIFTKPQFVPGKFFLSFFITCHL